MSPTDEMREAGLRRALESEGYGWMADKLTFSGGVAMFSAALTNEDERRVAAIVAGFLYPVELPQQDRSG